VLRVMTEPKNALVKQYKGMFAMDGVQLELTDDALGMLADIAMERETGVRSLRSMFEELLLEVRFTLASRKGERFVVTRDYVIERLRRRGRGEGGAGKKKTA
jgi:ATP-dependent Clp protease ATP-binding subunit ClpX